MATILIVDDKPENREYLGTLLGCGGHRLLEAADGPEGLASARAEQPDLIIADILMPTMDGSELVRQLRTDPLVAHTPVIFFTAHYQEREALALARTCGVSSVITKPAEPEAVLSAVEAALGRTPTAASPPATEEFDREHLRLLTDKLSQKAEDLGKSNERRQREEHMRLLLDSTAEAIYGIDLHGCCTFANAASARLLGYGDPGQFLGRDMHSLIHHTRKDGTPYPEEECRISRPSLQNRGYHSDDEVLWRADGSSFPAECWSYPIGSNGQVVGEVVTFLDLTERKRAEAEHATLQEQFQQAQKLETVGRLAGGVAHDFNNLLTVIFGYSDLLLQQLTPGHAMRDSVNEIVQAGQRAAALVQQLLLLSRKQVAKTSKVNLNDVITDAGKMLTRMIGEDIRLESVLSPSLDCLMADPGQLHQVLMNLAVNARDAMPDGGRLLIETSNVELDESFAQHHLDVKPGPYVQLKVSDTGVGMTKEVISHIFEPFYTTKKAGKGMGLGLATVYGFVKHFGGSIWVDSELGKGTTFTIYFPRIDAGAMLRQKPANAPATASLRGTETILLVEDTEQLRKMAGRILRSHGYHVLEAGDPEDALLQCERHAGPIHLLLTDVIMPGMTGAELAGRIRPLRPAMKIIFMSGYSERAVSSNLETIGSYLPKPFSPVTLATKVRSVLGSPVTSTILVVDEEPAVRDLLHKVLTGGSYQVVEAENGNAAVQQIEPSQADLVIMDMAMPEEEGIETIQTLRLKLPRLKIIAISGQFAGSLMYAAERLGAEAALAKPIQPDELLDTVARVMGG